MIRIGLALLTLSGCTASPMPSDLRGCMAPHSAPAGLPRVLDPAQLRLAYGRLWAVDMADRARGDDCADKLRRLNEWTEAHR